MFIDKAKIFIKAGKGGNGATSFHREKHVAAGGPNNGGDGGKGGNVIFKVELGMTTLMDFRYKRKYVAQNGMDGSGKRQKGKKGRRYNNQSIRKVRPFVTRKAIARLPIYPIPR